MVRVIAFFAVLLALALGLGWLADHPGSVVVSWENEAPRKISLMTAVGGLFLFGVAVILLWSLLRILLRLPSIVAFAGHAKRRARGFSAVSRGVIALGVGDVRAAQRSASEAQRLLGEEPMTLLLSAQAAQLSGDRPAAEAAFSRMLDRDETRVLGLRGLFIEARRKGDASAARFYAEEAFKLAPGVGWVNESTLDYRMRDGDWTSAIAVIEQSVSRRLLDRTVGRRQRAALLAAAALDQRGQDPDGALAKAQAALKLNPGLVPAAVLAARRLVERSETAKASRILEAAWKQGTHPDLADAYLDVRIGDSALDRLTRAKTLMKLAPRDEEGNLTVARAAMDAREFVTARETLQPLLAQNPSVRACLLMAEIEEQDGGATGSVREWLARASRARPDRAWVADGVAQEVWSPYSPVTGEPDAFVWRDPPQAASGQRGFDARWTEHLPTAPPPVVLDGSSMIELPADKTAETVETVAAPSSAPVPLNGAPSKPPPAADDRPVFPLPRSPDDPGPEATQEDPERRSAFRLFS